MPRYHIVYHATGILLDRGAEQPITGFVAPRVLQAKSETDAFNLGKIQLFKSWKADFNRDNRAGTPTLNANQITRLKNPFKKLKFEQELLFFRNKNEEQQHLQNCQHALKNWFRV